MKIYHLKVEIGFACDDPEHFSNVYTTFDNAKEAGKQYLEKKIKYVFENGEYNIKGKETPTIDELYVVRWLPKRVEGSPYFENTYALISNYYDGIFTHGEREYNIEKYEGEVDPESPIGFLQKIIKNEIFITEETWTDLKIGKILLDDRKNYKELLN